MEYKVNTKDWEKLISGLSKLELIELVLFKRASKRIENELFLMDFICNDEDEVREVEFDEVY